MVERSFSRIFEVELESDRLERECGLSLRGLEVNGLDQPTESHPSKYSAGKPASRFLVAMILRN